MLKICTRSPDRYISAAGSIFHRLSFQRAHAYNIPCKGVFVSGVVGSFKAISGCIILKVDDKDTPDLDSFQSAMKSIPDRARVAVRYRSLEDQNIDEKTVQIGQAR
jgi:pro-apoptotic serine protease NMA111